MDGIITVNDFLYKFFDLEALTPDYSNWKPEILNGNEPRYYRLLQILAILKYIGIESVEEFVSGKFIEKKDDEFCEKLKEDALSYMKTTRFHRVKAEQFESNQLPRVFERFLEYRAAINKVIYFNGGVLEASGFYLWGVLNTEEATEYLKITKEHIDNLLIRFIDPEKEINIPIEILVLTYGYPDVNLDSIDMRWE